MKKPVKNVLSKLVSSTVLATSIVACGSHTGSNSSTKVTNGREISETDFPSVVMLVLDLAEGQAVCTGTFVNDYQVLTAGHCVEGLDNAKPRVYVVRKSVQDGKEVMVAAAQALSFKRNPRYSIELGVSPYDLSVINFPPKTAPAVSALAKSAPATGNALTIVGYGNNVNSINADGNLDGSGSTIKRVGTNKVADVSDGFISFIGLAEAANGVDQGQLVSSGEGDSGGPLFVNGKLAGVTSGGGLVSDRQGGYLASSRYVDVNSSESRAFLATVLKSGNP